jgi:hypothetical protein
VYPVPASGSNDSSHPGTDVLRSTFLYFHNPDRRVHLELRVLPSDSIEAGTYFAPTDLNDVKLRVAPSNVVYSDTGIMDDRVDS